MLSFYFLISSCLFPAELDLATGNKIQSFRLFAFIYNLFGNREGVRFGIIDYELELVGLQMFEQSTLVKHFHFFVVDSLPIQLYNLLKPICVNWTHHCSVFLGLGSQPSLLAINKLCLPESHSLLVNIYLFVVVFGEVSFCFLLKLVVSKNGHA